MFNKKDRQKELGQLLPRSFKAVGKGLLPLVLSTVFVHLLALVGPVFISLYFDLVLPNAALASAITLTVGASVAVFFDLIMRWARCILVEKQALEVGKKADRTTDLYIRKWCVLAASIRGNKTSLNELPQKVADLHAVSHASFVLPFVDLWASVIYLAAIALIAGYIVLIPVTVLVILLVAALVISWKTRRCNQDLVAVSSERRTRFAEDINNLDQIILNGWYAPEEGYARQGDFVQERQSDLRKYSTLFSTFVSVCGQAQTVAILMGGFIAITTESISAGSLFAAMILSGRFLGNLGGMLNLFNVIGRYHESRRVLKGYVQNLEGRSLEAPRNMLLSNFNGHIVLKKVSLDYDSVYVFRDLDLEINPGEKIAIVGASGCGKSTLLKLIAGLILPSEGQILYDTVPHTQINPTSFLGYLGLQLQHPVLFRGTIETNFAFGKHSASPDRILSHLGKYRFCDFVTGSAAGIQAPVDGGGRNFSVGQRQALSIARLFYQNPEILLMDEPTNGLHTEARMELMSILSSKDLGKTVIFSSHDPEFIKLADRVVRIEGGKIKSSKVLMSKAS
ncbi:ATP-binding cassette domain-containing protein [Kiloniella sp. b19]|uniref:ATP-binding cassette domain-containing protein n=1 Tax=Kiloniella sp. GXU_MW_B19 TaxID=3141326 RepID=UPI0031D595F5